MSRLILFALNYWLTSCVTPILVNGVLSEYFLLFSELKVFFLSSKLYFLTLTMRILTLSFYRAIHIPWYFSRWSFRGAFLPLWKNGWDDKKLFLYCRGWWWSIQNWSLWNGCWLLLNKAAGPFWSSKGLTYAFRSIYYQNEYLFAHNHHSFVAPLQCCEGDFQQLCLGQRLFAFNLLVFLIFLFPEFLPLFLFLL